MFREVNVSPFATNALDLVGDTRLVTEGGLPVEVRAGLRGLSVYVNGECKGADLPNIQASYLLNSLPVGYA